MSDGKREIISRLISEYDIHSVGDIEEALKDLLGGTIKGMMEAEMENQKEETQKTEPDYSDQRNGYKTKTVSRDISGIDDNQDVRRRNERQRDQRTDRRDIRL